MRACRARRLTKRQIRENRSGLNLEHSSKNLRESLLLSRCRSFELFARNRAEVNTVARSENGWRIPLRIEQAQRRAADYVPAARRFDRIDSSLLSTDRNRTGRNFFAGNIAPRRSNFSRQAAEKRKTLRESDAMHPVLGSAVAISNF